MNLLIDMDGVITDIERAFWGQWRSWSPRGHFVQPEDRRTFYCVDELPEAQVPLAWALMNSPGFFSGMEAITGALTGLEQLVTAGHDVRICTAPMRSSSHCAAEKVAWVRRELGKQWLERLVITKDKTIVRGEVLIDDKPEVTGALEPEWEHLVFDWPYNRESPRPRVRDWDEILETFT